MNRFEGKILDNGIYKPFVFNKTECDGFRCWFYPSTANYTSFDMVISKYNLVDLPTLDVYTVRAQSDKGQLLGLLFDCTTKYYNEAQNFITAFSGTFSSYKEKDLTSPLKLRYRIKDVNLFSIDGVMSMASCPLLRDELEF